MEQIIALGSGRGVPNHRNRIAFSRLLTGPYAGIGKARLGQASASPCPGSLSGTGQEESARRQRLTDSRNGTHGVSLLRQGGRAPGVAADDGVGLHYRDGAAAYRPTARAGKVVELQLNAELLAPQS